LRQKESSKLDKHVSEKEESRDAGGLEAAEAAATTEVATGYY
jgi:hypothetical protein